MTIGISKDTLIKALADHECNRKLIEVLRVLINHCEELDPWLPIENAPKNRPIWLFNGVKVLAEWDDCLCKWAVMPVFRGGSTYNENLPFTHYKELPEDPEE